MDNLEEKTLKVEKIFKGKIIDLQVEDVLLPNGKKSKREVVKHPGAVAILAVTDDGKILLVEQYRKALERTIIEIPAGKLESGEDPLLCASRELEEETGYVAQKLSLLCSFYTSPGFANEIIHLYVAHNLSKKDDAAPLDDDEFVNLIEVTLAEAVELVNNKKIYDAKTAYAIQYLQLCEAVRAK